MKLLKTIGFVLLVVFVVLLLGYLNYLREVI